MEHSKESLPLEVRYYVVCQVLTGFEYKEIIEMVHQKLSRGISSGSISEVMKKYREHGSVEDLPRSGRPLKQFMEEERARAWFRRLKTIQC